MMTRDNKFTFPSLCISWSSLTNNMFIGSNSAQQASKAILGCTQMAKISLLPAPKGTLMPFLQPQAST